MAGTEKIRAPRGMPDLLPDQAGMVRCVENAAHRVFALYGFEEIRTPCFEETRLFVRGIGEATDIVEKEMYTFAEGDDSITLRPEATAPVVRAVIEHELLKKKGFWKLYYVGAMFRKERPQAGRLRQFSQVGCEAIGSKEPAVDAESLLLAARLFAEIGLKGLEVKLNTIGCPICRAEYRKALRAALEPRRSGLCPDCQSRFDRNIFRVLDCKRDQCRALAQDVPAMRQYLDPDCREHFETVLALLRQAGLEHKVDDRLVRGFDYYTRTVYELCHSALGARDAVCGGGRYDNLVEELGGPSAGCVGFAVGVVPTVLAMEKTGVVQPRAALSAACYVAAVNDAVRPECFRFVQKLRERGVCAEMDHERRSLKAQMRAANKMSAKYVLVVGPDELAAGRVSLKDMVTGAELPLPFDEAVERMIQEDV